MASISCAVPGLLPVHHTAVRAGSGYAAYFRVTFSRPFIHLERERERKDVGERERERKEGCWLEREREEGCW